MPQESQEKRVFLENEAMLNIVEKSRMMKPLNTVSVWQHGGHCDLGKTSTSLPIGGIPCMEGNGLKHL